MLRKYLPWLIAAVGILIAVWSHSGPTEPQIPRIVTVHDTVKAIDTLWITKLKHDTVQKVNIIEKVTVTKPETLYKFIPISGLTALHVPNKWGDSTLAYGFRGAPLDSGYTLNYWQYQYWTPGPLRSLTVGPSGAVVTDFYKPPPTCDLKCKGKIAGVSAGITLLIKLLLSSK